MSAAVDTSIIMSMSTTMNAAVAMSIIMSMSTTMSAAVVTNIIMKMITTMQATVDMHRNMRNMNMIMPMSTIMGIRKRSS